jgi:hypothetical protein
MVKAFGEWSQSNRDASKHKCAQLLRQLYTKSVLTKLEVLDADGTAVDEEEEGGSGGSGGGHNGSGQKQQQQQQQQHHHPHPLADAVKGPEMVAEAWARLEHSYRTGEPLETNEEEEIEVGDKASGGGTEVVFELDDDGSAGGGGGSGNSGSHRGGGGAVGWWGSMGPCAESELASFLSHKWPLLLGRACAAVESAKETEAEKLMAQLNKARTNEVKASAVNESREDEVGSKGAEVKEKKRRE